MREGLQGMDNLEVEPGRVRHCPWCGFEVGPTKRDRWKHLHYSDRTMPYVHAPVDSPWCIGLHILALRRRR